MLKKYITKLPDGKKTMNVCLLGRRILLTDGKIVNDSVLTESFTSYFKEYKEPKEETVIATPVSDLDVLIEPDVKDNSIEIKENSEIITEDSTEKIEPVKKRTRNTKK